MKRIAPAGGTRDAESIERQAPALGAFALDAMWGHNVLHGLSGWGIGLRDHKRGHRKADGLESTICGTTNASKGGSLSFFSLRSPPPRGDKGRVRRACHDASARALLCFLGPCGTQTTRLSGPRCVCPHCTVSAVPSSLSQACPIGTPAVRSVGRHSHNRNWPAASLVRRRVSAACCLCSSTSSVK